MKDFFNELSYTYEVRGIKVIHYLYFQSKQEILMKDFFNELSYIYEVRGTKVIHIFCIFNQSRKSFTADLLISKSRICSGSNFASIIPCN